MAGDFGQIARYNEPAAEQFIARRAIKPGVRVLDVACGAGNLAIPTAKTGAKVTFICLLVYQTRIPCALKVRALSSSSISGRLCVRLRRTDLYPTKGESSAVQ
jgi:SAM-dependent methyltransferase